MNPPGADQSGPPMRMLMGEGWIMCTNCGARLGSFDLPTGVYEDRGMPCPNPKRCREESGRYPL